MRYFVIFLLFLACVSASPAQPLPTNRFQIWLKGYHYRKALLGKPVTLQFTAVDGRKVDLSRMRGEVVLVDFWQTDCVPCVGELPRIKAALKKYHHDGFDVIGISDDTDKSRLERFLKEQEITWPQYFGGKVDNKFIVEFGINSFPHMFLVGRGGCLRYDDVRASGSTTNFEDQVEHLLAEK